MATGTNGSTADARHVTSSIRVMASTTSFSSPPAILVVAVFAAHAPHLRQFARRALRHERRDVRARRKKRGRPAPVDSDTLAATVALAMLSAALLALPIAWVYTLTRARRGYQQSVVQLLIILPVVVAGIVVLVKYSLALAFSLGGIAAAVRFRNTLDDSKDAVYVFLVTGLGIAAAVDLPVALVISVLFNVLILALWLTDFGRTPVALEGKHGRAPPPARARARANRHVRRAYRRRSAREHDRRAARGRRATRLVAAPASTTPRARRRKREARGRFASSDDAMPSHAAGARGAARRSDEDVARRQPSRSSEDGTTVIDYVVLPKKSKEPERAARAVACRRRVADLVDCRGAV